MLTLYGFAYSNYYNIVKHALLYKGVPFEEHLTYPNTPELLAVNPAGKVPGMITEQGTCLAESSVLVDYLEEVYPEPPLYPADAEARARVRQIMKVAELYLELPARRLLPVAFFDAPASEQLNDEARAALDRGVNALNVLTNFTPYVAGEHLTMADIYLRYALWVPDMVCPKCIAWRASEAVQGLADWQALMADSDISRKVDADTADNQADFMAYVAARK